MTPTDELLDGAVRLYRGDAANVLPSLPAGSADSVVTSPPYYLQRDYGHPEQIGQESSVEDYVARLVGVFAEVRRVLAPAGTLWLNVGDTRRGKQLLGVPWRVALALQADGWVLRSEIIWEKATHKPEKVRDRPTVSHEQVFLLTRRRSGYFYDFASASEPASGHDARPQHRRAKELAAEAGLTAEHIAAIRSAGATDTGKAKATQNGTGRNTARVATLAAEAKAALGGYYREFLLSDRRNGRTVWRFPSTPSKDRHAAVMAVGPVERSVLVGSPPGGVILDPPGPGPPCLRRSATDDGRSGWSWSRPTTPPPSRG
jgi:hypothetical protein